MKRIATIALVAIALLWSGLSWLFYMLAGSAGAAVVALTHWLELPPSTTQWLADGLAAAASVAQWLVGAVWLVGLLFLFLVFRLLKGLAARPGRNPREEVAYGATIEGEARRTDGDPGRDSGGDDGNTRTGDGPPP